jgi:hypothetical protein
VPASCHRTCQSVFAMADVSGAIDNLTRHAERLFVDAVDGMRDRVQDIAPVGEPDPLGRPRSGPRLIDTFFRNPVSVAGTTFRCTIGYTAPQAAYSNYLMPPHVIRPRGPYPLRFYWDNGPDGPGEYRFMKVNHPGNVNSRSLGWWDKTVTPGNWQHEVELAVRG